MPNNTIELQKTERITWIDTAKGFLLLCVIAGHSSPLIAKIVYSFHIPLFIILSGYTFKSLPSLSQIWIKIKKSFIQLFLPCILVFFIEMFLEKQFSFEYILKKLFYMQGIIWFFTAMFYSRIVYYLICYFKLEKTTFIVIFFLSGILLEILFPNIRNSFQNIDMIPVFVFCMFIGRQLKNFHTTDFYKKYSEKLDFLIVCLSLIGWLCCIRKYTLDFGLRVFYGDIWCVAGPVCAIIFILRFIKDIDSLALMQKPLCFLGKNTILILFFHELDKYFIKRPFSVYSLVSDAVYLLLRIIFCLLFSAIFILIKHVVVNKIILKDINNV